MLFIGCMIVVIILLILWFLFNEKENLNKKMLYIILIKNIYKFLWGRCVWVKWMFFFKFYVLINNYIIGVYLKKKCFCFNDVLLYYM